MIDVHAHFMTPEHWGPEFERHWLPVYGEEWPVIGGAAFDEAMAPVDVAVVFGITALASGVHTPTEDVALFLAGLRTRTVGFMALDPLDPAWPDRLDAGVELGFSGVKAYPVMAHFDPADRALDPWYEALVERRLPILWHMGGTPSSPGLLAHSHPLRVDAVATRHPELRQVIAHLGHPWQRDAVQVLRTNPNVYADVSGIWTRPLDGYLALVNAQEWGVEPKLFFGSDYPLWKPADAIDDLRRLAELKPGGGFPAIEPQTIETILAADPLAALGIDHPVAKGSP